MYRQLWAKRVGRGVIDCAISPTIKRLVAGDVDGGVQTLSYSGEVIDTYSFNMPVWGVDMSPDGDLVAIGLASKEPSRGALVLMKGSTQVVRIDFNEAVWDVRFAMHVRKLLASTWGEGLTLYDIDTGAVDRVQEPSSLFGVSISDGTALVTASGRGLLRLALDAPGAFDVISSSRDACYKNAVDPQTGLVFVGSSRNTLLAIDRTARTERRYATSANQICGIAVLGDFVFYGDLQGMLFAARTSAPGVPILAMRLDEAVWSIAADRDASLLFIASGAGEVICLSVDQKAMKLGGPGAALVAPPELLRGAKVFVSYASEDYEKARQIYDGLVTHGCLPWMDKQDLLPGENWRLAITRALKSSEFVILCLSHHSVTKRGFIQREIKAAVDLLDDMPDDQIFVIPVKLDDCEVPESLADKQWVRLDAEDGFQKLLRSIATARLRRSS